MKRSIWLILVGLLIGVGAGAQPRTSITIGTNPTGPNGPVYLVDGVSYISTQTFEWPLGSKHVVQFPFSLDLNGNALPYQSALNDNIRYTFGGWTPSNSAFNGQGANPIVSVSADPSLTTLIGQVVVNYRVHVVFPNTGGNGSCDALNPSPAGTAPGVVFLNGACINATTDLFMAPGVYSLSAAPYPGWVFYGYLIGNSPPNPLATVNITGPVMIIPQFSIAKRVDFVTNPLGLQILVDNTPINTPSPYTAASTGGCALDYTRLPVGAPAGFPPLCIGQFDFLPGSKHKIGAVTPQLDSIGNYWVFSAFSDGLGQNATYTADFNTGAPDFVTATFIPGTRVSVLSNPGGMKLVIDGRDNWLDYNFLWGQGETHQISAETPQPDAHGRMWQFTGWSDKGTVAHSITVPATTNFSVTANYSVLAQITINTSPAGLNLNVDGNACSSPCVINKTSGSTSQVTIPASIPAAAGSRFDFMGWSDGTSGVTRTVSFSQDTLTLTANYQTSFQLTAISNPPAAGGFKAQPASPDGFYPAGTNVSITAAANGGFKFVKWEGDLAGGFPGGAVLMSSPHAIQADFLSVPFIPPAGIQSVTGPTSDGTLAPGQLMSIYGQNLAPGLLVGPGSPLAQVLGNTTVTVGDYLLPLVFVSPGQISAQVPWELADGDYTVAVHNTGLPDVTGTVTISRAAPGVFAQPPDPNQPLAQNLPLALALHADGSVVTLTSPAVQGEQITIFATGLGAYTHPAVDGFPASPVTDFLVANSVLVTCGSMQTTPDWAGAASGIVGVSVIKLTITPAMPASTNANLTVAVNGKPSMPMLLPLQ